MFEAFDGIVRAGLAFAAVQVAIERLDQDVADQRTFARAGNAGDADQRPERNLDVDVLQVVVPGAANAERFVADGRGAAGTAIVSSPERYWPVRLRGSRAIAVGRTHGHDLAAAHAGARAEVDDVVGRAHRVFVVLDHDHRVALVAQLGQRVEQPIVVAWMQADRGLVENVKHADQSAADLAGQANPLRLAAGERGRGAVERQILEPHVAQKAQPAANFLEHFGGDVCAGGILIELAEKLDGFADRQCADFGQRAARPIGEAGMRGGERDGAGLRIEPLAAAIGTGHHVHVLFELPQLHLALRFAVLVQQQRGSCRRNVPPYLWPDAPWRQVYVMCRSPVPESQSSCNCGSSSRQGVSSIVPFGRSCSCSTASATPW